MADKHGAHQTGVAHVVSMCEDFCRSPSAPAGYMISQTLNMSTFVCSTVNGCGTPVLNLSCRIATVTGNEAGTGGGVVSSVNVGMCRPSRDFAATVRAEGQHILRHGTIVEMNCAGPEGPHNVEGKIVYIETQFDDARTPTPAPQPGPTPTPAPRRKVGEYMTSLGPVPIYEDPTMGSSGRYLCPASGPYIVVGPAADKYTLANEQFHADADARGPGGFDGIGHTDDGKELTPLENELGSDEASIKAADDDIQKLQGRCGPLRQFLPGSGCYFDLPRVRARRAEYEARRRALRSAVDLIRQGKLDKAREVLKNYGVYQAKVPAGPSVP